MKVIIFIILFLFILYKLILLLTHDKNYENKNVDTENSKIQITKNENEITEKWKWMDYAYHNYSIVYHLSYADIKQGYHNRMYEFRTLPMSQNEIDYSSLINSGGISFMDDIINQLQNIATVNRLNYRELADVTVSMIQNIPYTLIHQMSHDQILKLAKEDNIEFIISYHNDPVNHPYDRELYGGCRDSVEPGGVYAPAEFLSTMKGDCDTRTLFLFTLMKKMGYDVAILNGPGHSMLGCNLIPENPSAPYITENSSKYYFWETTIFYNQNGMTGPRLGDILDSKFNVNEWKIMLN